MRQNIEIRYEKPLRLQPLSDEELIGCFADYSVRVFNLHTEKYTTNFRHHISQPTLVTKLQSFGKNSILSVSAEDILLWNLDTEDIIQHFYFANSKEIITTESFWGNQNDDLLSNTCLLYTSLSPRDQA
eukprot:TRINITY_DN18999_c0_g1_i1.p1 TRINITY_DN18999_c0_g1~~TRINITY_DN18999_c0_g1_i1.p1  ORF type:complete len:129 (+),score=12.40 TRINITY_DN18999_c0_g1_i1:70-456(+)